MQFGWRTGPDVHVQRAASALFKEASGWSSPTRTWLWGAAMAAWALASEALHVTPDAPARFADLLASLAPRVFMPGTDAPDVVEMQGFVVLAAVAAAVAAGINLAMAARRRRALQAGFAAAEARLGAPFVATPGQFFASLGFLLFWIALADATVVALIWALLAAQAATGVAVRLLAAPGRNRMRLAGRLARGSVRGLGFAATLVLAALLVGQAWVRAPSQRPPPAPEAPPASLAPQWDAAVADSLDGRGFVEANRSLLEVARGADATLLADLRRTLDAARSRDAARWQALRLRHFAAAEIADGAGNAGMVPGGGGHFAFRVTRATEGDRPGTVVDIFDLHGSDDWGLSVRATFGFATVEPPMILASPAGTLLVVPATSNDALHADRTELYLRDRDRWHWIDVGAWLREAAAALPPGACLLRTDYATYEVPVLPTRSAVRPDFPAMRVNAAYGRDPRDIPVPDDGRLEAALGIADGRLVLRDVAVTPPRRPSAWLARVLASSPRC